MRTMILTLGLTAAILFAAASSWKAEATVAQGAAKIGTAAQSAATPIKPAACRGGGAHCPPGWVWNGRRCVPC